MLLLAFPHPGKKWVQDTGGFPAVLQVTLSHCRWSPRVIQILAVTQCQPAQRQPICFPRHMPSTFQCVWFCFCSCEALTKGFVFSVETRKVKSLNAWQHESFFTRFGYLMEKKPMSRASLSLGGSACSLWLLGGEGPKSLLCWWLDLFFFAFQ